MKLKFYSILILLFSILNSFVALAQEEITDEELTRYAVMMDSIDVLKGNVEETIKEMVASTEEITGTRYNELYKYSRNTDKLAELEANEAEVEFLNSIDFVKDSMTLELKKVYSSLAKDYVGDGGRTFNKISKALKSDEDVKQRYDAILLGITEEEETEN